MDLVRAWNTFQAYSDLLLRRVRPRAYPLELSLGTSSFCNLRCIMCPREDHLGNLMPFDQPVDLEFFHALGPYLRRANEASLYGLGEPLLDKEYFEKVSYVRSFGVEVTLSTNGIPLDERRRRMLIETGVRGLGVSLDAVTPETYAVVRPPGGFEKAVGNLKALVALRNKHALTRPIVVLSFAMMRQNLHEVPAFPSLVKEIGADEGIIHTCIYMSRSMKERIEPDAGLVSDQVRKTLDNADQLGVRIIYWDLDPLTYLRSLEYRGTGDETRATEGTYYCRYMWRNAMLQGRGELFPCCYMTNHRVGTLAESDLRALRGSDFLAHLRRLHFQGKLPAPCVRCPQLVPYDRWRLIRQGTKEIWHTLRRSKDGTPQNRPVPQRFPQ